MEILTGVAWLLLSCLVGAAFSKWLAQRTHIKVKKSIAKEWMAAYKWVADGDWVHERVTFKRTYLKGFCVTGVPSDPAGGRWEGRAHIVMGEYLVSEWEGQATKQPGAILLHIKPGNQRMIGIYSVTQEDGTTKMSLYVLARTEGDELERAKNQALQEVIP